MLYGVLHDGDGHRAADRVRDGTAFSAPVASSLSPALSMPSSPSTTALRWEETTLIPASPLSAVTVAVTFTLLALPPCLVIVP